MPRDELNINEAAAMDTEDDTVEAERQATPAIPEAGAPQPVVVDIRQMTMVQEGIKNELQDLRRRFDIENLHIIRRLEKHFAFLGQKLARIINHQEQGNITDFILKYENLRADIEQARAYLPMPAAAFVPVAANQTASAREDDEPEQAQSVESSLRRRIEIEQAKTNAAFDRLYLYMDEARLVAGLANLPDLATIRRWEVLASKLRHKQSQVLNIEEMQDLEQQFADLAATVRAWLVPAQDEAVDESNEYEGEGGYESEDEEADPGQAEQKEAELIENAIQLLSEKSELTTANIQQWFDATNPAQGEASNAVEFYAGLLLRVCELGDQLADLIKEINEIQPNFGEVQPQIDALIGQYRGLEADGAEYNAWRIIELRQAQQPHAAADDGGAEAKAPECMADVNETEVAGAVVCEAKQNQDDQPD